MTTLTSPVYITTTDANGVTSTTAPPIITTTSTTTSNGVVITVTEVVANADPTLSNNNGQKSSSAFFSNTGAVAGVFVLVGLAAASILLFIFFAVRRRRRTRRLEHDTAVSATLAAAGFNRAPLDDDDDDVDPRASGSNVHGYNSVGAMPQRSSSGLAMASIQSASASGTRMSHVFAETTPFHDDPNYARESAFDPFSDHPANGNGVQQPPPSAFHMGAFRDRTSGSGPVAMGGDHERRVSGGSMGNAYEVMAALPPGAGHGHNPSASYGSTDPLLSGYRNDPPGQRQSSLPPPYAAAYGHLPQQSSSSGSSPSQKQPPVGARAPNAIHSERSSVYSAASGDPHIMTGIAVSTDDLDPSVGDDPFAAAIYVPPKASSSGHGHHDDRLDARMLDWMGDDASARDLRDEEDYSRRVLPLVANGAGEKGGKQGGKTLGVRNVTEGDLA